MSTLPNLPAVLDAVRILSPVSTSPSHGEEHWRRVATAGLDLAGEVGADPLLVVLFALFHDCMRFDQYRDPDHGKRGGFLACCLNNELIGLSDDRLDLLYTACAGHPAGNTSNDPTVGVCWDADRLDLYRFEQGATGGSWSTTPGRTTAVHERAMALVGAPPEWESIFRRLDPQITGVRRGGAASRPESILVEPRRPEPILVEPHRPEPILIEPRIDHALVEPNRRKPAPHRRVPASVEPERTPPPIDENRRVAAEAVEGQRYWTATLIHASSASPDEASTEGIGGEDKPPR
jgi:uncharacterized protein